MEIKLYYFNKETSNIEMKVCVYDMKTKPEVEESGNKFDFDLDKVMIEMLEEIKGLSLV